VYKSAESYIFYFFLCYFSRGNQLAVAAEGSILKGVMEARVLREHEGQLKPELSVDMWKNRSTGSTEAPCSYKLRYLPAFDIPLKTVASPFSYASVHFF
jgi:hypothetical protein